MRHSYSWASSQLLAISNSYNIQSVVRLGPTLVVCQGGFGLEALKGQSVVNTEAMMVVDQLDHESYLLAM